MKYLILPLLLILLVSSCKKEEGCTEPSAINYNADAEKDDGTCLYITGCTDATAINYNTEAVDDDGSCLYKCTDSQATNYNDTTFTAVCEYESAVVIWLDGTAVQYFTNLGIPVLSVHAGNVVAGSMPTESDFFLELNEEDMLLCADTNSDPIHYTYQWQDTQITTLTLTVYDGELNIIFQSTEDVLSNGCTPLQLTKGKIEEYQDSQ